MLDEARSTPERVGHQLGRDEGLYQALGARLRERPPRGALTVARGSSDHAAAFFSYLSAVRGGHLVTSLPMSLITLHRAPLRGQELLTVAVSQSGGSPDLRASLQLFGEQGGLTVAAVNDTASPLAQTAQWVLPLHAQVEDSVAATKSFICSLTALARLAGQWCNDGELLASLTAIPACLQAACAEDWSAAIGSLVGAERILVIGRGTGMAVALEAALKFKETCGIQAEAFTSAEVRHGPMALVNRGYPVLVFAPRGPAQADLLSLAYELRQRAACVLLAAPADVRERELTLVTTGLPELDPLAAIQSFYLMVEMLARARKCDPDRPRHLQKITATL
ncbi:SIS domain-containing protein [Ramlibacter tataouinensis]|uniref:SIS domain-containing protein n=1 Tax=Ramlibacter tataouinensis (strain ATCC BAA-407 / DSM 14655 / LMG 21543 / TTB310) TaxID=365046 RepID=F5XW00_RAMTT|nr:SIS domain-containing protein [Ramlibacter tataouinensis]AEG94103.1 Conserved hypothetical protein [Ramlibacter tataouinensis TTB310]